MVVGRTDHLPGGAAPNWVSPKQGSGPMARHAVTASALAFVSSTFSALETLDLQRFSAPVPEG